MNGSKQNNVKTYVTVSLDVFLLMSEKPQLTRKLQHLQHRLYSCTERFTLEPSWPDSSGRSVIPALRHESCTDLEESG
ncbi:hypothetical protein J6590_017210 [Homalodisca vitripennis]|nr:hypothetical protein J6590_017210 [Homalodisca vitripennis]